MAGLESYVEVVLAQTNGRKCHKCGNKIMRGKPYLHMERNRHIYCVCGMCLVMFATQAARKDPEARADAVAEII
jgi:hypothetical protein